MPVAERSVLVIDEIAVNQSLHGMMNGMMLLFAAYYCFNIQYPHELAATLECIQKVGLLKECSSYNTVYSRIYSYSIQCSRWWQFTIVFLFMDLNNHTFPFFRAIFLFPPYIHQPWFNVAVRNCNILLNYCKLTFLVQVPVCVIASLDTTMQINILYSVTSISWICLACVLSQI